MRIAPIGPGIDRPVRVPAGARVDGADVQARRAADAVQRLAADLVGQHVGAPVVEQHEVELARPVALGATPVQSEVYGFIRSPVEERGSSWSITSRSRHSGSTFSIPITVTRVSGSVVQKRPLPSDSTTHTAAGLGHAEVRAAHAPSGRRGTARADAARASRPAPRGSSGRLLARRDRALEQRADLARGCSGSPARGCATACRRPSCTISSARSVSTASMPSASSAVVQPDLVGGERLDLDHLARAARVGDAGHDRVRLRARRGPSAPRRRPRSRSRSSRSSCSGSVAMARALIAAPASRSCLPVGQLRHHGRRAWPGSWWWPSAGCGAAGCPRARCARRRGSPRWLTRRPPAPRPGASSARLRAGGAAPPPMCIRHELSAATHTSARGVRARARSLSASIAADMSAFLTANVPPKPQHSSASGSSTSSSPRTAREQPQRPVAHVQQPGRVAGGVIGHRVREGRAHVLHPEPVHEELAQLDHARHERPDLALQPVVAGQAGDVRVLLAHHAHAGGGRRDHHLGVAERVHEAPHQRHGLELVAAVGVHLPAAGLLLREVHLVARAARAPPPPRGPCPGRACRRCR